MSDLRDDCAHLILHARHGRKDAVLGGHRALQCHVEVALSHLTQAVPQCFGLGAQGALYASPQGVTHQRHHQGRRQPTQQQGQALALGRRIGLGNEGFGTPLRELHVGVDRAAQLAQCGRAVGHDAASGLVALARLELLDNGLGHWAVASFDLGDGRDLGFDFLGDLRAGYGLLQIRQGSGGCLLTVFVVRKRLRAAVLEVWQQGQVADRNRTAVGARAQTIGDFQTVIDAASEAL